MPRALQWLDVLGREKTESPPRGLSARRRTELWLAVHLPNLAFDALPDTVLDRPAVVAEPRQGRPCVAAGNAAARAAGIGCGTALNAARVLSAQLHVYERSPSIEQRALESLAAAAHELTSAVSLEPPDAVLLEVAGSLKLFRDLAVIKRKLGADLGTRGWAFELYAAPTALAALWLARHSADRQGWRECRQCREQFATDRQGWRECRQCREHLATDDVVSFEGLASRLAPLPLAVTRWPATARTLLEDIGVRTLGECLRLPRDGFARRVGPNLLHDLDRALGRRLDPRAPFTAAQRWQTTIDLGEETSAIERLLTAVEQAFDALVAELRERQAQIQSLEIALVHLRVVPTELTFEWVEPTHERERLSNLVHDRLERLVLPEPAVGLRFRTGLFQPLAQKAVDLFVPAAAEGSLERLLERLRGRLGTSAVHGLVSVAEHRPELAWSRLDAPLASARRRSPPPHPGERPLWLLSGPVPLDSSAARRHYTGTLELRDGPERIESGWWDERDISRDYYTAETSTGQRLWIYRDRVDRGWHLHGLFG